MVIIQSAASIEEVNKESTNLTNESISLAELKSMF